MSTFTDWEGELYHHGILGMKWGVRRYQNEDGTWTEAGLRRRNREINRLEKKTKRLERKKALKPKLYTQKELEERIKRLELEKRYKDLYRDINRSDAYKIGRDFIAKTLMDAESVAALGARNTVNWLTEKTVLERGAGIINKFLEVGGNAIGNVAKLRSSGKKNKDKDKDD